MYGVEAEKLVVHFVKSFYSLENNLTQSSQYKLLKVLQ
jgi:hypothetical protein